jgi:antitoxin component YwqK of YwqJK toxin-antitoxin module
MDGFLTIKYTHDTLGRILTKEYVRDIDSAGSIVRSLSFNTEAIKYANFDLQTKRTFYNNYDLPYLDEYFNYNEMGYLMERIERIKMTSAVYTFKYEYNDEGKLSAIRRSSNKKEGYTEELLFKYDELGNLIEKHIYKNGIFTTDIQIIYSSKTKLLQTVLTREVSTDFLMILRFKDYEYFN